MPNGAQAPTEEGEASGGESQEEEEWDSDVAEDDDDDDDDVGDEDDVEDEEEEERPHSSAPSRAGPSADDFDDADTRVIALDDLQFGRNYNKEK